MRLIILKSANPVLDEFRSGASRISVEIAY